MRAFSIALLLPFVLGLATPAHKRGSGTGPISIPISARVDRSGTANIVEADRARARALIDTAQGKLSKLTPRTPVSLTNTIVSYTISIGVGSPQTNYDLVVDTGSSNTWVGADPNKPYVETSTSVNTGENVSVTYGSGSFSGTEFIDQITFGDELVFDQSIGSASASNGFQAVDGILGIGPTNLTKGTIDGSDSAIPTVVDTLFQQGLISNDLIGIYFEPTFGKNSPQGTGQIDFGDIDPSKPLEPITYTQITSTSPASTFWGIDQTITLGDESILSQTAGIMDTGTTLVLLATDAFQAYKKATGASFDENTGLLTVTREQFAELPPLIFQIDDSFFQLTADAQAWPQQLNDAIGGDPDSIYLIVSDLGTPSGQGLDFINGQAFLQRFYSVYDTTNQRVGISITDHTFEIVNVPLPS